jgi:Tol biopolymer transport system component/DNA-binding winged helix-turn-helix (wHTH) protein
MESSAESDRIIRFAEFELDLRAGELRRNGHHVILPEKPFQVLTALLECPGEMVRRDELVKRLWPAGTFVDFNVGLNKAVNRLRHVLHDSAEQPRFIETFPKRGYRFVAPIFDGGLVQRTVTSVDGIHSAEISRRFPISVSSALSATPAWRRRKLAPTAVFTVIAASLFVAFLLYRGISRRPRINIESLRLSKLTDNGKVQQLAISPDGRYIVFAMRESKGVGLHVLHVGTRSHVEILPPENIDFHGMAYSPDGNYIYFASSDEQTTINNLHAMPVLGGPDRLLMHDVDTPVSFSPNGHQFAFTRGVGDRNVLEVRIANADGRNDRLLSGILDGDSDTQPGPAWSPDGRVIAVPVRLRGKQLRWVLDVVSVTDGNVQELHSNMSGIGRPAWLPDGNSLIVPLRDSTGRGQLWIIPYPRGKAVRLTNDLENYQLGIDLTRDGKSVAAIATTQLSDIWTAPAAAPTKSEKMTPTPDTLSLNELTAMPLGKVLARSRDGEMWLMKPDGSGRTSFTTEHNALSPTLCGHFVVFNSFRERTIDLVRADADGLNPTRLFSGDIGPPACSPDGKSIFFVNAVKPYAILRLSSDGGIPTEIVKSPGLEIIGRPAISPDGKFIAYAFDEADFKLGTKLAIVTIDGGAPLQVFKSPSDVFGLRWSPDGQRLQYLLTRNGAANIWEQPFSESVPRQFTSFPSGKIFDFSWSLDGKQLLLSRGEVTSDLVLLSNLR